MVFIIFINNLDKAVFMEYPNKYSNCYPVFSIDPISEKSLLINFLMKKNQVGKRAAPREHY